MSGKKISFVIPALNEEAHIRDVINSIKKNLNHIRYEIILMDNGSVDATAKIAEKEGAVVFCKPKLSISALRNLGVAQASGEIIVFLDADVILGENWGDQIEYSISLLKKRPFIITGSTYGIEDENNWIERCWFKPWSKRPEVSYLNGGHLIILKEIFEILGGFREDLETGEDYDLCKRAKKIGMRIVSDRRLKVVHKGYPKTLVQFLRRERWHGRGDFKSIRTIVSSKPALLSLAQLFLFFGAIFAICFQGKLLLSICYLLFLISSCLLAAARRCGIFSKCFFPCSFLYAFYFIGRILSFIDISGELVRQKPGK